MAPLAASLLAPLALAVTFTVAPDGSGDFPTIADALFAAAGGDTIQLLPGTFTGEGNRSLRYLGRTITVRSRDGDPETCIIDCEETAVAFRFDHGESSGSILEGVTIRRGRGELAGGIFITNANPTIRGCILERNTSTVGCGGGGIKAGGGPLIENCIFRENLSALGGGALCCSGIDPSPTVRSCVFLHNRAESWPFGSAGAVVCESGDPTFESCTFWENSTDSGAGAVLCMLSSPVFQGCTIAGNTGSVAALIVDRDLLLENTIIAFHRGGPAFYGIEEPAPTLICCDLFGNEGGDWTDCIAGQEGVNGNLSLDPLFCGLEAGDLTLREDSPCAEGNNHECGRIGAWSVGCTVPTAVLIRSWGWLKSAYAPAAGREEP